MSEQQLDSTLDNLTVALNHGAAIGPVRYIDENPFFVVPEGFEVHDLGKFLDKPARKQGRAQFNDAHSFCEYFKKHQMASTIYGQKAPPKFLAVFNDHRNDEAGHRDFTATYNCPLSKEWNTWNEKNGKAMTQAMFAQFIEDNLPDIVEPAGADMLEISRTLEAKKKVNFASGIRLSNGEQELTYEETVQGTASKGKLQIPETFSLGIAVLEGGTPYKVTARLRYRIQDGNLSMWFDLLRPHKILEDAANDIWTQIEAATGQKILNGTPA